MGISHEFVTTDKTTSGLELLNTRDYNKYILKVEVTTTPTLYQLIEYTQPIQFYNSSSNLHTQQAEGSSIVLKLAGQSYRASSSSRKRRSTLTSDQIATNTFEAFTYNYLTNLVNGQAYISAVELVRSTFSTTGSVFSYKGVSYSNADASCVVSTDGSCTSLVDATTTSSTGLATWVIIVICLVISFVLGVMIVGITCYMKKEHSMNSYSRKPSKVGPMANCFNPQGSVSTIGSSNDLLRISGSNTPDSATGTESRTMSPFDMNLN